MQSMTSEWPCHLSSKFRWATSIAASNISSRFPFAPSKSRRYRHKRTDDEDAPPPRQEARPALAAGVEANTSSYSVRASLSVVDLYSEDENGMSAATGGVDASADSGAWGDR